MLNSLDVTGTVGAPANLADAALPHLVWRGSAMESATRDVAEEMPVSFVYDGGAYAVMMATPADLEDYAVGFALTEGIIDNVRDIASLEIIQHGSGVELRHWLGPGFALDLARRRRVAAGPTGCGLCGIESLDEATRAAQIVHASASISPGEIIDSLAAMAERQALGRKTRASHAAGFWRPRDGLLAIREDVGRHNALDKLAGSLARAGTSGSSGAVLLTSRVSLEMVQKTAAIGAGIIIAISAPTTLAVRTANAAGITLVAVARGDGFEVYTHPRRISAR